MQGCVSASLLRGQRTLENDCMYIETDATNEKIYQ